MKIPSDLITMKDSVHTSKNDSIKNSLLFNEDIYLISLKF